MNPLVIMGFNQKEQAEIKNDPWDLVYQLLTQGVPMTADDVVECVQNNDANALTMADIFGRSLIYCYSWGLESLRKVTKDFTLLDSSVTVVIVLGVEDPTGATTWNIDLGRFNGRAYAFVLGPDMAFPVDISIKDAPWVDFDAITLTPPCSGRLNINIKALAKPVNWLPWTWGNKVDNHTHVENNAELLKVLVRFAGVAA